MKKSIPILLLPVLALVACKNDKKDTPKQMMDETPQQPSANGTGRKFSVDVPEGWTTKDTTINGLNVYYLITPTSGILGNTVITIGYRGVPTPSPEQYEELMITTMKSQMAGFELKDKGKIDSGNFKGFWFKYKRGMAGGALDAITYVLSKDDLAYVITASTPKGFMAKYRPTFDAVVHSFKLKSE